jgi:hypothetical protein
LTDASISNAQAEEITFLLDHADIRNWRPVLYVINRAAVATRMVEVPGDQRASPAPEYIVQDLEPSEFDVLGW